MEKELTTARQVSDYFIVVSHEVGDPISNLKLQKLLYYAQAWFLAFYDKPLFDENIEAWVHGPVVPPVYGQLKVSGLAWQPIMWAPDKPVFPESIEEHLIEVMERYGRFNAYQLELLTHSENPWRDARKGIPSDEYSNAIIPREAMRDFYRSLSNEPKTKKASTKRRPHQH
jgi:uncharacterized phage-associated protein